MTPPHLSPIPEYADLMPISRWQAAAADGGFIPYDGDGYWATSEGMDRTSDVWYRITPPDWVTHVAWFNR